MTSVLRAIWLTFALFSLGALAQERGRTDGPEGSELGKGGYQRAGGGRYSLTLNWGASLQDGKSSPPLFFGATGSFWADDWFVLDLSGSYLLNSGRLNLLAGPKLRTAFAPISGFIALQAGAMVVPESGLRFGLSPQLGGDLMMGDHLLLGLGYALDLPIGGDGAGHRVFMNVGYRF